MNVQTPRRLVLPAPRRDNDERFLAGRPWFRRPAGSPPEQSGPALLTFTGDDFVERFFQGLARSDGGATPDAFERLLAWRDWAEPPAALLDAADARLYPAGIERSPPLPHELADGEAIPDQGPHPWLRKLYLPTHGHFHLCALELACRSHGYPKVARARVRQAGAVLRRLVPRGDREVWEDWVEGPRGEGAWVELADSDMQRLDRPERALDPAAVEAALAPDRLAELHARLQVDAAAGERLVLATDRLALVPRGQPGGEEHCVLYGYLPVFSSAREGDRSAGPDALAEARARLRARAEAALRAAFFGRPEVGDPAARFRALRRETRAALGALLEATILPPAPPPAPNPWPGPVEAQLDDDRLRGHLLDALRLEAESLAPLPDWWGAVVGHAAEAADRFLADLRIAGLPFPFRLDNAAGRAWLAVRLRQLLLALVRQFLPLDPDADAAAGSGLERNRVLATALLRLRAGRLELMERVTAPARTRPLSSDQLVDNTEAAAPPRVTGFTVASAAAELDAWLESNEAAWRALNPLPWPRAAGLPGHLLAAHRAGVALETALARWDEQAADAGSAYLGFREQRLVAARSALDQAVSRNFSAGGPDRILLPTSPDGDAFTARELGIATGEPPAFGLFGFPGLLETAASFETRLSVIADRFLVLPDEQARSELKARSEAVRPRLDSDHLYAVWAYARIAGRDACERERIVWSGRGEVFQIAEPLDLLGLKPAFLQLPDLRKMLRDLPRVPRARARPKVSVATPAGSGFQVGAEMADTRLDFGLQLVCTHGIPVFTICAWILFQIVYNILIRLPGFTWMLLLKLCLPGRPG